MKQVSVLACAAALVLAACGDPLATGDPLTPEEAEFIAQEMAGSSFDALGDGSQPQPGGPAGAAGAVPFAVEFSASDSCDGGGSVNVSGRISGSIDDNGSGKLKLDVTQSITNCQLLRETVTYTVSTDPDIKMSGDFQFTNGEPAGSQKFKYEGGFRYTSSDNREGGCQVRLEANFNPTTGTGSVSGSVCGHEVTVTVS